MHSGFLFSSTISHNKWNILIKGKLRTDEIASDRKKDQKRIHIPVHDLCWNFLRKMFPTFSFKLFLQTARLRCFARFSIRFWGWMQITITLPLTKRKGAVRLFTFRVFTFAFLYLIFYKHLLFCFQQQLIFE